MFAANFFLLLLSDINLVLILPLIIAIVPIVISLATFRSRSSVNITEWTFNLGIFSRLKFKLKWFHCTKRNQSIASWINTYALKYCVETSKKVEFSDWRGFPITLPTSFTLFTSAESWKSEYSSENQFFPRKVHIHLPCTTLWSSAAVPSTKPKLNGYTAASCRFFESAVTKSEYAIRPSRYSRSPTSRELILSAWRCLCSTDLDITTRCAS